MNAIVPVNPTTNVEAYRASTDAAALCREIVVASAMEIQQRKYVKVEGWQAIAIAHGCTGSARDVERVEGGVRAIGEVRRMSDGQIIATAEGFVGEDEPTWFGGKMRKWRWGEKRGEKVWYEEDAPKRPDYAIRAMAQTRAVSRACRSAFAHVVVMMNAGLSTTPAEEVPLGGFDDEPHPTNTAAPERPPAATPGPAIKRLNSAEAKRIGLDKTIADQIWACSTRTELAEWDQDFDKHTAQCPIGWLDAIRNDVILRGEAIDRDAAGGAAMDAEFSEIIGPAAREDVGANNPASVAA